MSRVDEFQAAYQQQLMEQVAQMVWDQARVELEREVHELRAQNAELRRRVESEAHRASLRLREVESEVLDLKDRNAELVAKCAALGRKANETAQEIDALEAIRSRLGRMLKKSDRIRQMERAEMMRRLCALTGVDLPAGSRPR